MTLISVQVVGRNEIFDADNDIPKVEVNFSSDTGRKAFFFSILYDQVMWKNKNVSCEAHQRRAFSILPMYKLPMYIRRSEINSYLW